MTSEIIPSLPDDQTAEPVAAREPTIANRLAAGVFWTAAGSLASGGFTLLAAFLVARQLGPAGYGKLAILQSTVGLFGVLAGFGLSIATTKYVAEWRNRDPDRAGRVIGLATLVSITAGGLLSLVLFLIAPELSRRILIDPQLDVLVKISCILVWAGTIDSIQNGILNGLEAFRALAILRILRGCILIPCLVGGAVLNGVTGAVWGSVAVIILGLLSSSIALWIQLRDAAIPVHFGTCLQESRILWDFGLPALLSTGIFSGCQWAAEAILVRHSDGYAELGFFQAANRMFVALQLVSNIANRPLLPVISEQSGAEPSNVAAQIVGATMAMNALLVGGLAMLICFAGPYLMPLFGPAFATAWPTLLVVLLTAVVTTGCSPVGHWVMASGQAWTNVRQYGVWGVTLVLSTIWLARWGALGLAVAELLAYGIYGALAVRRASRFLSWSEITTAFGKGLTSLSILQARRVTSK